MFFRLLILFVATPLIELALLLKLAEWTSGWFTIILVVVTGFLGAALARRQGWQTWRRIRTELQAGQMPGTALADAMMILVAGALLLTPGILTDLFGFSLLLPPCRRFYRRNLLRWLQTRVHLHATMRRDASTGWSDEVIDAVVLDKDVRDRPDNPETKQDSP